MDSIVSKFRVKTDQTNEIFEAIEYQEFTTRRTVNGELVRIDGLKRFELAEGLGYLNCIDANTFQVFGTNQIVRRLDPV